MRLISLYYLFFVLFISCDKGELAVLPYDRGEQIINSVEMGEDYGMQIFFKLSSNSIVSENLKSSWDLGFEASDLGWRIFLNSSKLSSCWKISNTPFESSIDLSNAIWKLDSPDGNLDSTAIGDYRNQDIFFILDRGLTSSGAHSGYKKIKFESVSDNGYMVRYANLDNTQDTTIWIEKNPQLNQVCFSFTENKLINIEPNKLDWDLLFTQYTNIFYNPTTPYLVTGVLINTSYVAVALDTVNLFSEINYEMVADYEFTQFKNSIGYSWKYYNFDTQLYTIETQKNYIIRDEQGRYFKLHFIDFYNDMGIKGSPKFEFKEL